MIAVDTNVLIHAHRSDCDQHARALEWLRKLAEGQIPWALPVLCIAEFARVVSHPRVFSRPSTIPEISAWVKNLLESPSLRILNPGKQYPGLFLSLLAETDMRGNLAFDAQIAAVCLEHGVDRLLTLDRDFDRVRALKTVSLSVSPSS